MPEVCEECGFDADAWRVRDAATLFDALGMWWRLATDGIDTVDLNRRPTPGVWSAAEYGLHSLVVTAVIRDGLENGVPDPDQRGDFSLPDASPDDPPADLDIPRLLRGLEREGRAMAGITPGEAATPLLLHAVHDATHHMMDVGRGLAAMGAGTPAQAGVVARVNASEGGVPKLPTDGGPVGHRGLAGDRQANRKHHGRPFQALCLWSTEVLDELAGQGHPIGPGSAGENLTLSGIDWASLRPGARLRLGTVLAELSFPAVPCANQTQWFSDGDFRRIAYERNPQWVRWYAWVREPGEVRPGDAALVAG